DRHCVSGNVCKSVSLIFKNHIFSPHCNYKYISHQGKMCVCACVRECVRACVHAHTNTHTHTRPNRPSSRGLYPHTFKQSVKHTYSTEKHASPRKITHTHMHPHTCTHTHTHTNTIQSLSMRYRPLRGSDT